MDIPLKFKQKMFSCSFALLFSCRIYATIILLKNNKVN